MCKNASSCCWIVSFYGWHSPWPSTSRSPIRFDRASRQSCAHAWSTAFLTAVVHDDGTDATPTLSDCQWCHQCHLKPQCASASTRRHGRPRDVKITQPLERIWSFFFIRFLLTRFRCDFLHMQSLEGWTWNYIYYRFCFFLNWVKTI